MSSPIDAPTFISQLDDATATRIFLTVARLRKWDSPLPNIQQRELVATILQSSDSPPTQTPNLTLAQLIRLALLFLAATPEVFDIIRTVAASPPPKRFKPLPAVHLISVLAHVAYDLTRRSANQGIPATTGDEGNFVRAVASQITPPRAHRVEITLDSVFVDGSPDALLSSVPIEAAPSMAPPPEADIDAPRLYDVFFATNRCPLNPANPAAGFSAKLDSTTRFGSCRVVIPQSHKFGSIGSSWLRRFYECRDDRLRLAAVAIASQDKFWNKIQLTLADLAPAQRHALVYVHGYNNSFQNAAIRAAQIGFDLKVPGLTAFFSWASKGSLDGYLADEDAIQASEPAIADFLVRFLNDSSADRVHLVAHSMGNRGLLRAMQRIAARLPTDAKAKFGQIFLAAPDVNAELFRDLATLYPTLSERTTLYISRGDRPLECSSWAHDFDRAGFAPPVTIVPGIDTIEVTDIDLTFLGHGYYAEAAPVLHDMFDLLRDNSPPQNRLRIAPARDPQGRSYWSILA